MISDNLILVFKRYVTYRAQQIVCTSLSYFKLLYQYEYATAELGPNLES
jgi:hypothetical protein